MKSFFIFLVSCILFIGCDRDESLDPRPVIVSGAFVRLDIINKRLNSQQISTTTFGGLLTTPSGKVSKYNLYVRRRDANGFVGEFKLLTTITSFPQELKVTPQNIADALSIPVSSIVFADTFRFYGESFDTNGVRSDYSSLSQVVQTTSSMKQAYRFITDVTDNGGFVPLEYQNYDNYIAQ